MTELGPQLDRSKYFGAVQPVYQRLFREQPLSIDFEVAGCYNCLHCLKFRDLEKILKKLVRYEIVQMNAKKDYYPFHQSVL